MEDIVLLEAEDDCCMTSAVKSGVYVIGDKRNDPNRKMVGPKEIEAAIKNVTQYMRGEKEQNRIKQKCCPQTVATSE